MDNGLAVIVGGAVGVIGAWGTTWLNHYFAQTERNTPEEAAKAILASLLETPEYQWRRLDTLANVVGTDEPTVRRLLLEVGARGSMRNGRYWGLVSRNPIRSPDEGHPLEDPSFPGSPEI